MAFQTLAFVLFLAAVCGLYWRLPAGRLWLLAIANAGFYLAAGPANLALFGGASFATYLIGNRVAGPHGRAWLWGGVLANVANLACFKYAGFLTGAAWAHDLLLPIGISFYTFQHISYLVDRRQRSLPAAASYLRFWVYISFFGHSIAGPIMRGHEFLPQIDETAQKRWDPGAMRLGLGLFALGALKKLAIADQLAPTVALYFDAPYALTLGEAWAATLCFSFQIYYDFSAYSDMAVGIGLLFGYELRRNFLTPYVAADPAEFWRRWHVTLSEWIRDYVYIPLGGNRGRYLSASTTLMLAMLASGLWHGANATFVLWGAWHGLLLVGHRAWRAGLGARPAGPLRRNLARLGLFGLVTLGWVLFRAPDVDAAAAMLLTMLDPAGLGTLASVKKLLLLAAGLYALHALEAWGRKDEVGWGRWWVGRTPWPLQGLAYAAIALALMATYPAAQPFIYFRF